MVTSTLSFAGKNIPLAPPEVIDALFGTVSYRLEPQGLGSRFPCVMNGLYRGLLRPPELPAALAELGVIAQELRKLPASQAIESLNRLVPFRPQGNYVNPGAAFAFDLFAGSGGQPLITAIQEAVGESTRAGVKIALHTPFAVRWHKKGLLNVALGALWTGIGCVYFPHDIIVPMGMHSGPLAWSLGPVVLAGGLISLMEVPAPGRARRRVEWISSALIALMLLVVVLAWRTPNSPAR
jgi:2,3-bisphosphoglycerate-dependent phosphoglycerate mutase